jgi:cbb3-type cytochrome oxidase subunit 3
MKAAAVGILVLFFGAVFAHADSPKARWRVAQSANACLINCASQNDSCKRMCPSSYSGPCLSACDNQAQFCQQNCQRR